MAAEDVYAERAKRLLRTEMTRKGVSYDTLAERLTALGMPETAANLRNKVSRGKFTAAFLIATCVVLEVPTLRLAEVQD